jgi:hypothetical protein
LQEEVRAARAANADQAATSREASGTSSQFYGLYFSRGQWMAEFGSGGERVFLGRYDEEVVAARAVDDWLQANGRVAVNLDENGSPLAWQQTYVSIYTGVSKNHNRWQAKIKVDKKWEPLGTFDTQTEAAQAYDTRARQLRNPRRGTNFRLDGTCNEVGPRGKVLTEVEEVPAS